MKKILDSTKKEKCKLEKLNILWKNRFYSLLFISFFIFSSCSLRGSKLHRTETRVASDKKFSEVDRMIYPIVVFGDGILRGQCKKIEKGTDVNKLVDDMFATMYNANGVGLAGPQIGKNLALLVIDFYDYVEEGRKRQVEMINPELTVDEDSKFVEAEEGCLSLPGISRKVFRRNKIRVKYFDRNWNEHDEVYEGFAARIVQHEYDHLYGKLFIDYSETATIQKQLKNIKNRNIETDYEII